MTSLAAAVYPPTESEAQPERDQATDGPTLCHATVSRLTLGLSTVAAMCQHSNEHLLKVEAERLEGYLQTAQQ